MLRFAFLTGAAATAVRPLAKVISLLEDMKNEIEAERSAEMKTYNDFSCACKDSDQQTTKNINEDSKTIDETDGKLAKEESNREDQEATIAEKSAELAETEDLKEKKEKSWLAYSKEYRADFMDVAGAEAAAKKAKELLAPHKAEGFMQISSGAHHEVRRTLLMAEALGYNVKETRGLLQMHGNPDDGYDEHSDAIHKMVTKLYNDFKERKEAMVKDHNRRSDAHTKLIQGYDKSIGSLTKTINETEKALETTKTNIATHKGTLTTTQAQLHDRIIFLKQLQSNCEQKASTWDQRQAMRNGEVDAIKAALKALGIASAKDDSVQRALLQKNRDLPGETRATAAKIRELTADSQDADTAESEVSNLSDDMEDTTSDLSADYDSQAMSLVQTRVLQHRRTRLAAMLTRVARRSGSTMLQNVAAAMTADPLAKVKQMIQDLIERLNKEQNAEATQHGWCQTELGKAKTDRDFANEDAMEASAGYNKEINIAAEQEALIKKLTQEIKDLNADLRAAEKVRSDEKSETAKSLKTAREGRDAVKDALRIIKNFYRDAGNTNFQTEYENQDGPRVSQSENYGTTDAGSTSEYKGKQGAGANVMGLLEVVQTDFERAMRQYEAFEEESYTEFTKFDREARSNLGSMETGKANAEDDMAVAEGKMADWMQALTTAQSKLDLAFETLEKLRPACVNTGMTATERAAKRAEEIKALETARDALKGTP